MTNGNAFCGANLNNMEVAKLQIHRNIIGNKFFELY